MAHSSEIARVEDHAMLRPARDSDRYGLCSVEGINRDRYRLFWMIGAWPHLLPMLTKPQHEEFHALLAETLKRYDLPLRGHTGSTKAWAEYFTRFPGLQRAAFGAVWETSTAFDFKHGTSVADAFMFALENGSFKWIPRDFWP